MVMASTDAGVVDGAPVVAHEGVSFRLCRSTAVTTNTAGRGRDVDVIDCGAVEVGVGVGAVPSVVPTEVEEVPTVRDMSTVVLSFKSGKSEGTMKDG